MNNSYPKHRKKRIESQLVFINDTGERQAALQALSILNRVIEANNAGCEGCTADCVNCKLTLTMVQKSGE
jgi:hypothetical protein